jgi:hypothetical protein
MDTIYLLLLIPIFGLLALLCVCDLFDSHISELEKKNNEWMNRIKNKIKNHPNDGK